MKQKYGIAYILENETVVGLCHLPLNKDFSASEDDKAIVDFLYQHTREILEISYKDNANAIKKVKLSYE